MAMARRRPQSREVSGHNEMRLEVHQRLNMAAERTALREIKIKIDDIYVPVKRRKTFDSERANVLAEDILVHGQKCAILVRKDNERFVLVEGLHRLEACKALGEETILACVVQARRP